MKNNILLNTKRRIHNKVIGYLSKLTCFGLIFLLSGCSYYDTSSKKYVEADDLFLDFEKWTNNVVCYYYEKSVNLVHISSHESIHLTNDSDYLYSKLVCASKTQLILSSSSASSVYIELCDYNLLNRKTLLLLYGNSYWFNDLQDGTVDIWHSDEGFASVWYNADFQNGLIKNIKLGDAESQRNEDTYFKFIETENDYIISKNNENIVITHNKFDSDVLDLFNKWDFIPSRCRVFDNGIIWLSFNRNILWREGQKAIMLVSYDYNVQEVTGYQFLFVESLDYSRHYLLPIYDNFKDELTFIN